MKRIARFFGIRDLNLIGFETGGKLVGPVDGDRGEVVFGGVLNDIVVDIKLDIKLFVILHFIIKCNESSLGRPFKFQLLIISLYNIYALRMEPIYIDLS